MVLCYFGKAQGHVSNMCDSSSRYFARLMSLLIWRNGNVFKQITLSRSHQLPCTTGPFTPHHRRHSRLRPRRIMRNYDCSWIFATSFDISYPASRVLLWCWTECWEEIHQGNSRVQERGTTPLIDTVTEIDHTSSAGSSDNNRYLHSVQRRPWRPRPLRSSTAIARTTGQTGWLLVVILQRRETRLWQHASGMSLGNLGCIAIAALSGSGPFLNPDPLRQVAMHFEPGVCNK